MRPKIDRIKKKEKKETVLSLVDLNSHILTLRFRGAFVGLLTLLLSLTDSLVWRRLVPSKREFKTATADVEINVRRNGQPRPIFSRQIYTAVISEYAALGSAVVQLTATDADTQVRAVAVGVGGGDGGV